MSEIRTALERRIPEQGVMQPMGFDYNGNRQWKCDVCSRYSTSQHCPECNRERDEFIDECCLAWEIEIASGVRDNPKIHTIYIAREFLNECMEMWEDIA